MQNVHREQVIDLSKEKWHWMSERDVDTLDALFHEKAVFVHMGGSWGKELELDIIKSGGIHYKEADIHKVYLLKNLGGAVPRRTRIMLLSMRNEAHRQRRFFVVS